MNNANDEMQTENENKELMYLIFSIVSPIALVHYLANKDYNKSPKEDM